MKLIKSSPFYCSRCEECEGQMRADMVKWTLANGNRPVAKK